MPTLPTRDDLGGVRARAAFSPTSYPNSPVGGAIANLGQAISGIAQQGMQEQQRQALATSQTSLIQFGAEMDKFADESRRAAPVGAVGYSKTFIDEYDRRANEMIKVVPPEAQQRVARQLQADRARYEGSARDFETRESDRAEGLRIEEGLQTLRTRIDKDPSRLTELEQHGRDLIATSKLPAARQQEAVSKWREGATFTAGTREAMQSGRTFAEQPNAAPGNVSVNGVKITPDMSVSQVANAFYGANEVKDGGALSSFIQKAAGLDINPANTAWCAAFINAALGATGRKGTGKLNARSFLDYGTPTDAPSEGDIVVLQRGGRSSWMGHVGLVAGFSADGKSVKVLGGNQGNKVSVAEFPVDKVLGYRKPPAAGSQAPQSSIGPVPVSVGSTKAAAGDAARSFINDPRFDNLTVEQRRAIETDFVQGFNARSREMEEAAALSRAEAMKTIGPKIENATAEIMATGTSANPPTESEFFAVYGDKAPEKFQQFNALVETGQQIGQMRTMPSDEIPAFVQSQKPQPGSPTYAQDAAQYEALTEAAKSQMKARNDDPFAYTAGVFPEVAQAWDGAVDRQDRADAIEAMAAAQAQLGIAQPALIPQQTVAAAMKTWGDVERPYSERMNALGELVFAAETQPQRDAIMDQLVKAGAPAASAVAVRAYERGDVAAAERLSRAILADPKDMPNRLPDGMKDNDLNAEIIDGMFAPGTIGDAMFGTAMGVSGNDADLAAYNDVARKAVRFALAANGGDTAAAIATVQKDMFGDVALVTDTDMTIAVPKAYEPEVVTEGLRSMTMRAMEMLGTFAEPPDMNAVKPDDRAGARYQGYLKDQTISDIMAASQWRNAGDGQYQLIDATTGLPIADRFGNVLSMSAEDAVEAGLETLYPPGPPPDAAAPIAPLDPMGNPQ